MASTLTPPSPPNLSTTSSYLRPLNSLSLTTTILAKHRFLNPRIKLFASKQRVFSVSASASSSPLQALIFDCDGVILESEHLHRQAYNDAFTQFNVRCPSSSPQPLSWGIEFYDELQNRIGGGKPKMRWFFHLFPFAVHIFSPVCWILLIYSFVLLVIGDFKVLQGAWVAVFHVIWDASEQWWRSSQVNWHSSGDFSA